MKRDSDVECRRSRGARVQSLLKHVRDSLRSCLISTWSWETGRSKCKTNYSDLVRRPGEQWCHWKCCSLFLKRTVSLEAIIVTFVNRSHRRTNIVHLSIKMKNWNKCLGLPSANRRWCVLERCPGEGRTNAIYLPSKGLIATQWLHTHFDIANPMQVAARASFAQ